MKKIIAYLIIMIFMFTIDAFAEGNVVRVKATGETIYRQKPNFEDGKGIKSALVLTKGKYTEDELEELLLTEVEFMADVQIEINKMKAEEDAKNAKWADILGITKKQAKELREK